MIEKLIEQTNTIEFYQNADFHLTKLKGQIGQFKTMEFKFVIEERDDNGKTYNVEHWKLIAHRTIDFSGIYADLYLPYIKLKILKDHPLLWTYTQTKLECELIKFPENPSEFLGDLFFEYEKVAGNWIPLHKNFRFLNEYYRKNGKWNFSVPKSLQEPIENVCKKHGIDFTVKKEIDGYDKGYANRPNVKLLIFGNEDTSPDNYNGGQPYIIAEEFIAKKN